MDGVDVVVHYPHAQLTPSMFEHGHQQVHELFKGDVLGQGRGHSVLRACRAHEPGIAPALAGKGTLGGGDQRPKPRATQRQATRGSPYDTTSPLRPHAATRDTTAAAPAAPAPPRLLPPACAPPAAAAYCGPPAPGDSSPAPQSTDAQ